MKGFVSNSIFYHNGRDGLAEYKLPTLLLDALELFELPVGHPAHPGHGVRTRVAIAAGTDVTYYAGIYRPGVVAPDNPYVFGVQPLEKDMVIDAAVRGNITRFINDPRGTGLEPNLVADDMVIVGQRMELRTVVFRAICDIQPGEELTFAYEASVKGYWSAAEVAAAAAEEGVLQETTTTIATNSSNAVGSRKKMMIEVDCEYRKCNRCGLQLPESYFCSSSSSKCCTRCEEERWEAFKKRSAHKMTKAMLLMKKF